jgi:subtilisin family serine protease
MNLSYNKAMDTVVTDTNADDVWQMKDVSKSRQILGSNVRVAIIDSGIDWTHPSFYNPLKTISWSVHFDKTAINPSGNPYLDLNPNQVHDLGESLRFVKVNITNPDGTLYAKANIFDVGVDYLYLDINNNTSHELNEPFFLLDDRNLDSTLSAGDIVYFLGLSKIEKIYDVKNGQYYTRGVDLTDPLINTQKDYSGHGTHVAGIIAGGNPGFTKFTGIAPNATLLIAKAIDDSTGLFPEKNLIAAIDWAIKENADVISMSLGGYDDRFLDGSDKLDQKVDEARQKGIPVVVSAGNFADKSTHAEVATSPFNPISPINPGLPTNQVDVEWTLLPFNSGGEEFNNDLEVIRFTVLWRQPNYLASFEMTMPDGTSFVIPTNTTQLSVSDINDNDQYLIFSKFNVSSRGTNKQYIEIRKLNGSFLSASQPSNGDTEHSNPVYQQSAFLRIKASTGNLIMLSQEFQVYISDNRGGGDGFFTKFVNTNQISADHTVTSPATADSAVSVGSYITKDSNTKDQYKIDNISGFSSRGTRIDGVVLPVISAPGEYIFSASSKDAYQHPANSFISKMGTSMAAPVVSGTIALMVQYQPNLSYTQIKDILTNSTNIDNFVKNWGSIPNNVFGYGKINASLAVLNAGAPSIVSHQIPRYYATGNSIPISAVIYDISGLTKVTFRYSVDGAISWNSLSPSLSGSNSNGNWSTLVPAQSGVHLLVQIKAEDIFGIEMTSHYFLIAESNGGSTVVVTVNSNITTTETSTVTETSTTTETSVSTVTGSTSTNEATSSPNSDTYSSLNFISVGFIFLMLEILRRRKSLYKFYKQQRS